MKKLIIAFLFFLPAILFAQGFQLNLQSVRQTGMGATGVANPLDASSLYYNPGGAAFLSSNSISGGIFPVVSKGTYTDAPSGKVSNSDNPLVTPFFLHAVFGDPKKRLRYGVSVYTPFGSTMDWGKDFTGHYEITKISLISVAVQPTLSFKVTDKLGIGAGFVYSYGHIELVKDLPINMPDGSFANADIKSGANSYGYNLGIYYKFSEKFSAAVTYRSALKMKTNNGKADFTVPSSLTSLFPDQGFKAELPLPDNFSIGFAYRPNNKLTVELDAVTANWKPYDTITIKYDTHTSSLTDTKLIRLYKRAYSIRAGAEYKFSKKIDGRIGLSYNKSPIPNDLVNPDVPDANRLNPFAGLSYNVSSKFSIDASFQYEHIKRVGKNRISGLDGTYKFNLYIPGIAFAYKF